MSATTPELKPLPVASLPAAVQKLLAGPAPMKAMAAKGIAPLRPGELLTAIYQLSFDSEASVRTAADGGGAGLPDKVLAPALAEPLPPEVLQFFASKLPPDRLEPLEKILYNPATGDGTFVLLAGRLNERELEIIFQNEARMLRTPAILEALYANPQARMSSVNRAIELCVRNNVRVEGIPSFDEVARSISQDAPAVSTDPTSIDQMFSSLLAVAETATATGAAVEELAPEPEAAEPAAPEAPEKSTRKSPIIDFTRLKLYEKIRLATLGNEYCRSNLMRDPNRMVAMAAIRSPRITDSEILKAASNRSVSEDVIRYIANQRDLTKNYQVRLSLVHNPKCPVALSMKYLPLLNADDLKHVSKSKNVPGALSTGAKRLLAARATKQ
jgi:hypothetical protein